MQTFFVFIFGAFTVCAGSYLSIVKFTEAGKPVWLILSALIILIGAPSCLAVTHAKWDHDRCIDTPYAPTCYQLDD